MDSERTVYLDGRKPPANQTSLHGFSTGRWEDKTLVVETVNFREHPMGLSTNLPSSTQKRLIERFSLSLREYHIGDARPTFVVIPTGIWHGLQNLGSSDALVLNFPTEAYSYEDPDHWRLPFDTDQIPYSWRATEGARLRADAKRGT
jgi:hypothetical protein